MRLTRQEGARSGGPGRRMEDVFTPGYGKPSRIDVTCHVFLKAHSLGTSLVVQWLGLSNPNAGSLGSIPGQGTSSHMQQIGVSMLQLKSRTAKQNFLKLILRVCGELDTSGWG